MTAYNSKRAVAAPELLETMTGSTVIIGSFVAAPMAVVFDNLGDQTVTIYVNDVQWKTFAPGSALVLDMETNDTVFNKGDVISGNGASGDFSVAYIYARPQ